MNALDDDPLLTQALAAGDVRALGALYDRYGPMLLALAARITGSDEEAEDLLHELFLEVWRKAGTYDPTRGTVRTWLLLRMRSRALDRRRSAGRAGIVYAMLPVPEPPQIELDDRAEIHRALVELGPDLRRVVLLAYFEGMSATEIAGVVGVPVGTVKSRLARAVGRLRVLLR
jgi:RNA polymerase sigma-70 factor, ECF subfamily